MALSSAHWLRTLVLVVLLGSMSPSRAEWSSADEAAIDKLAKRAIIQGQTAGLVVAVSERGEPAFVRGYGFANKEWEALATPDTVFRVGSITKQFASACILLLAEQNKLTLDDKLARYFPDFPRAGEVTLRQLMNHTSGIHSYPGRTEETISRVGIAVPEMVKHLGELGYDFDPGTQWSYSNSGYFLLGAVIETVSGQSFREFASARLFQPLGLAGTAIDLNEEVVPQRASGYERDKTKPGRFLNAVYTHMSFPHAAGSLRTTAPDLIKWTEALHGGRVLSAASYKEMTTAPRIAGKDPVTYGLGLVLAPEQGHALISHGGSIDGFEASLNYLVERKMTLVILTNTDGGVGELRAEMLGVLLTEPR